MAQEKRPWEWRRVLWSRPGEAVPEKMIIVSLWTLAFGLLLLAGVLFFGAGFNVASADPRLVAGTFAAGFILVGLFGVQTGFRQHGYADRMQRRGRRSRGR